MSEESKKNKSDVWEDPRFSKLVGDPRFRNLSAASRKVKVDKRFQSMFNNESFRTKFTIDKYGRPINQVGKDDLKKYYEISSSESDDENAKEEAALKAENENDELVTDGEFVSNELREKLLESSTDFARGEGRILTDSSSDDESSDDDEIVIEHVWGELDADAPKTDEITYRLAACNMDWDRIRASDIMVLCNSFLPHGGLILSVKIYVSEYGKERLKQEDILGPIEMINDIKKDYETESDAESLNEDADDGDEYEMEKLRQYQLNRLKYYYAVIECDSKETADKLYTECDGLEYESTATKFDLRFIPDNEKFYAEEIKDECTQLPDLLKYKPRLFTTTALQQAKVALTWDETSTERRELSNKLVSGKFDEVNDHDLKQIICCSSSEENDSNDETPAKPFTATKNQENKVGDKKSDQISKYKSLLDEINRNESVKNKNKYEMEFSWGINVKDDTSNANKEANKNLTVIEKILDKKKDSKKRKKQMKNNDNDNGSDDLPDGIDLADPYFAEEFATNDFEPLNKNQLKKKCKTINSTSQITDEQSSKELELLVDDENHSQHFSLTNILKSEKNKKKKLKKQKRNNDKHNEEIEDFKINTKDQRFKDVYESHLYNIDPSDSHFKNTKGMQTIIEEKMKRINEDSNKTIFSRNKNQSKNELKNSILIKNLKRKINK